MENKPVDLRSDTVTKPTTAMRKAMAQAEVGDDVMGEDPTVNRLQARAAELFGREAALYVPSGTMGNQICIKVHTRPGQAVVGEADCHIFGHECGMYAQFSGAIALPIHTSRGFFGAQQVADHITPPDVHVAPIGLVLVENTHNMKGGGVYPQAQLDEVAQFAHSKGIPVHMDGARVFNASVASGRPVSRITQGVDSVMFCFSKGLGAPVGSMIVGRRDFIEEARAVRKKLGGGMRQVGILAAACLHALDHHVERMAEDHAHAKLLEQALKELGVDVDLVETNIVFFTTQQSHAQDIVDRLQSQGVLCFAITPRRIRLVTHLDVGREDVLRACEALKRVLR